MKKILVLSLGIFSIAYAQRLRLTLTPNDTLHFVSVLSDKWFNKYNLSYKRLTVISHQ